jgi:hypothetical protein
MILPSGLDSAAAFHERYRGVLAMIPSDDALDIPRILRLHGAEHGSTTGLNGGRLVGSAALSFSPSNGLDRDEYPLLSFPDAGNA